MFRHDTSFDNLLDHHRQCGDLMALDPQAKAFLAYQGALNLPDVSELGIAARFNGHEGIDMAGPIGDGAVISHRFITTPTADVAVRIYTPKSPGPYGGFIYFHGGGWVLGHIDRNDAQLVDFADRTHSIVLSVNYQKSPEHKFPIPHDDCYAGVQWLFANAANLNIDTARIGVGGDSAGGNLAAGVALRARDQKVKLAYQLLIYPATQLNFDTDSYLTNSEDFGLRRRGMIWFWSQYLNSGDEENPYAVPGAASDLSNLAPAIISTAEFDVLRDDGLTYAAALRAAGNKVTNKNFEGQIHGFINHAKMIDASYSLRSWIINQVNALIKKN